MAYDPQPRAPETPAAAQARAWARAWACATYQLDPETMALEVTLTPLPDAGWHATVWCGHALYVCCHVTPAGVAPCSPECPARRRGWD
ncbi:MAG: hypothetical protein KatS3mg063_2690 [Tepidiforma sp.]|uniref:hypothetical protein n=1 Tax=Tepidiforma sp. TaxID=2682230 RepID=UPI0021DBDF90|nr:hypothetical protein [Tepidiforma sp.]GIW16837.1 MAG: hypothetical protein KatS3mg063_2690 [Tepidiforma sp.]